MSSSPTFSLSESLQTLAKNSRQASRQISRCGATTRTAAIKAVATSLHAHKSNILAANERDISAAINNGLAPAMIDRLRLDETGIINLINAVNAIAAQQDPIGLTTRSWQRPNGLKVEKMRLPLGVILMIYESRPNVTVDAAALCLRSGNAIILRGGSEAKHSNRALADSISQALLSMSLNPNAVQLVPTQDRAAIDLLLHMDQWIDLVIPRGGEALIRRVVQNSHIAVVQHYKGICHLFVDKEANIEQALEIIVNSKTQRPGVCNALETLLVDHSIANLFIEQIVARLTSLDVTLIGCPQTVALAPQVRPACTDDWNTEFLNLTLAIRVVTNITQAIEHIDQHGTGHTAVILTQNNAHATQFIQEVETSCVMVNASTRFNDGGELGLGAEMGISTTRIHAYGPMGAEALTCEKFVVRGEGQIRQ